MCQIEDCGSLHHRTRGVRINIPRVGLEIARVVIQVHGESKRGVVRSRKTLARAKVPEYSAQLPSCLIETEGCGTSHYWARELTKLGIR